MNKWLVLMSLILFAGCGASPEWKAAGIKESETENYWKSYGIYSPSAAKTYMSCGIKAYEVGYNRNFPNSNKYGYFNSPEIACSWKNWCSNCMIDRIYSLDKAGIKPNDNDASDWYEILSMPKVYLTFPKGVDGTEYIRAAKEAGLTPSEVKKFVNDFYGLLPMDNFKLMGSWKQEGFSIENDILNKNNCKGILTSCYKDISPSKTKELIQNYGFNFTDAIYVQKSGKDPIQLQSLSKELNISLSIANIYLTYFDFSDSKRVYTQTKSINETNIRLLSEYMKKGQNIAQAQKSIKDHEERVRQIIYRNNYDTESCEVNKFNTKLNSKLKKFDCHESILGGYDRCSAEFDIDVSSSCKKSFTADVECKVKIEYQVQGEFMSSKTDKSESEDIYARYGSGHDELKIDDIKVSSITGKTYRAKVSEAECEIDYIRN